VYEVVLSKEAAKTLERVTKQMQGRVVDALEKLKVTPFIGKRLHGELGGLFSLRIGGLRAIYEVDSKQKQIVVYAIGSRGDIYKK
jgi:mRNA interferase RelE/StbE